MTSTTDNAGSPGSRTKSFAGPGEFTLSVPQMLWCVFRPVLAWVVMAAAMAVRDAWSRPMQAIAQFVVLSAGAQAFVWVFDSTHNAAHKSFKLPSWASDLLLFHAVFILSVGHCFKRSHQRHHQHMCGDGVEDPPTNRLGAGCA